MNQSNTSFCFEYRDSKQLLSSRIKKEGNELVEEDSPEKNIVCAICDQTLHELALICPICYHGGHINEIYEYFSNHNGNTDQPILCPKGCNHQCFSFN